MLQFKLTNFFSEWPDFYASLPPKTVNDSAEKLSNVFDPEGKYMGNIDEALESILFYFKNSKGFRKLFTGYSEAEKDAIAIFIGSDDAKKKFLQKMRKAYEDFVRSQGKTVEDYSYDIANGFADKGQLIPNSQQEIAKHKKLAREAEDKLNRLPVTRFGGAKDQAKADELARKAAYHEKAWRDLEKGTGSAAPNRIAQQANKAGVIGSPTAQAVSVRNKPFTYEGPDGKLVEVVEVGGVLMPGQRCFEARYGNGKSATFIFADNWALADSYDQNGEGLSDEYTVEAIQSRYNPKSNDAVDKRVEVLDWRGTTRGGKALVGEQIAEFAERKDCLDTVRKVARWLNKLCGHGCGKGTAVGKNYSTLLIDISYEDAAISIYTYSDNIKLKGQFCEDFNEFKAQFNKHYVVVKSLKKG